MSSLKAISPIDGRYSAKTECLRDFFSEFALIKYRLKVEIKYFQFLCHIPLPQLKDVETAKLKKSDLIWENLSIEDAIHIKEIERITNHDVKAVEYFIKEKLKNTDLEKYSEFVHFGLTSQDINNTAVPLLLKDSMDAIMKPALDNLFELLQEMAEKFSGIPMLARTHGQPASPTTLGKEIKVFTERLEKQLSNLQNYDYEAKFGGATGNLNAHKVSFPGYNWPELANEFIQSLGLKRQYTTTQIAHYDELAALLQSWIRINTILIDLCRDFWTYISMDYFRQKAIKGEIGSSAMPHKVNPIDFENAEGNLGIANAIFEHLALKLPVSRLQRDLTDSTVLRNIGVPFGHSLIAIKSISKGLRKLFLNQEKLEADLRENIAVVAEAIQSILRREGYPKPYEALKELTRGNDRLSLDDIHQFIDHLQLSEEVKNELKNIKPENYIGYY